MTQPKVNKPQDMSKLMKKLKSVCPKCSNASIKVYLRNIKRLWKLVDSEGDVPLTGVWLSKPKLFEEYKKKPLKIRRHLSTAAVKASQAFKVNGDKWSVQMYKDSNSYERKRNKNLKTETETKQWPKKGFKSVAVASKEMMKRVRILLKDPPTMKVLYKYQMALVLRLFQDIPFRNTFATLRLSKGDHNYVEIPKKDPIQFVIKKHKAAKHIGPRTIKLKRGASIFLKKFLKYRKEVVDNDFLLNTMKEAQMSRATMSKALHRVTKELLGKSFGSRLIRVLAATSKRKEIELVQELGHSMLHGNSKQTAQYSRKD